MEMKAASTVKWKAPWEDCPNIRFCHEKRFILSAGGRQTGQKREQGRGESRQLSGFTCGRAGVSWWRELLIGPPIPWRRDSPHSGAFSMPARSLRHSWLIVRRGTRTGRWTVGSHWRSSVGARNDSGYSCSLGQAYAPSVRLASGTGALPYAAPLVLH